MATTGATPPDRGPPSPVSRDTKPKDYPGSPKPPSKLDISKLPPPPKAPPPAPLARRASELKEEPAGEAEKAKSPAEESKAGVKKVMSKLGGFLGIGGKGEAKPERAEFIQAPKETPSAMTASLVSLGRLDKECEEISRFMKSEVASRYRTDQVGLSREDLAKVPKCLASPTGANEALWKEINAQIAKKGVGYLTADEVLGCWKRTFPGRLNEVHQGVYKTRLDFITDPEVYSKALEVVKGAKERGRELEKDKQVDFATKTMAAIAKRDRAQEELTKLLLEQVKSSEEDTTNYPELISQAKKGLKELQDQVDILELKFLALSTSEAALKAKYRPDLKAPMETMEHQIDQLIEKAGGITYDPQLKALPPVFQRAYQNIALIKNQLSEIKKLAMQLEVTEDEMFLDIPKWLSSYKGERIQDKINNWNREASATLAVDQSQLSGPETLTRETNSLINDLALELAALVV